MKALFFIYAGMLIGCPCENLGAVFIAVGEAPLRQAIQRWGQFPRPVYRDEWGYQLQV